MLKGPFRGLVVSVAVDKSGNAVRFNGTSWTAPTTIDHSNSLTSVSCPTASSCTAVGDNGDVVTFNGTSWTTPISVVPVPVLVVSCPTTTFCTALDSNGEVLQEY